MSLKLTEVIKELLASAKSENYNRQKGLRTLLYIVDRHESEVAHTKSAGHRLQALSGLHGSVHLISAEILLEYHSFVVLHVGVFLILILSLS